MSISSNYRKFFRTIKSFFFYLDFSPCLNLKSGFDLKFTLNLFYQGLNIILDTKKLNITTLLS